MLSREQTLIIEADEGGVKREWIRRGGERLRGGTGKQMLVQQHSMLATIPPSSGPLPFPAPLSLPHLLLVPLIIFAHYLPAQRGS